jgi:hypothetical protein
VELEKQLLHQNNKSFGTSYSKNDPGENDEVKRNKL